MALKAPHKLFNTVYGFPPNRDTLGGTAYLILENDANRAANNILVDCPAWNETIERFLQENGGVRWLVLTHRGGHGRVAEFQKRFHCEVVVQEQEAYLLPGMAKTTFTDHLILNSQNQVVWTAGHSPGSACLYHQKYGGVLFTGRHLLPSREGYPAPLRMAKTFHWPRQLRNVERLLELFTPETLTYLCPGANTGFLRGERVIADAYRKLAALDLEACLQAEPLL